MTFDEFKVDFFAFLEDSTVNLGRKTTKTRRIFIDTAIAKFDAFMSDEIVRSVKKKPASNPMGDSVIRIKPDNHNKALDVGKGVHAMTPSESARADEQLNRSPYGAKTEREEK